MDNRERILQDYFDVARSGEGITEEKVRAIVAGEGSESGVGTWRRFGRVGIATLLVVIAGILLFFLLPRMRSGNERATGTARGVQASRRGPAMRGADVPSTEEKKGIERSAKGEAIAEGTAGPAPEPMNQGMMKQAERRTTQHSTQQKVTNVKLTPTMSAIAAAIVAMSSATMSAQAQEAARGTKTGDEAIVRQMHEGIGYAICDYWTPRLNTYKVRIDRMLSPDDLAELNRLRIRFGVLAATLIRSAQSKDGGNVSVRIEDTSELNRIFVDVKDIATRYRAAIDPLGESVLGDIGTFLTTTREYVGDYVQQNKEKVAAPARVKMAKVQNGFVQTESMVNSDLGRNVLKFTYTAVLEPLVMLYDGTDLKTLMQQVRAFSGGKSDAILGTSAIAGSTLPDVSVLKQCVPSPASTIATIPYALTEGSDRTLLRIYDSRGALVESRDEGSRPAGEHRASIDVSKLPLGTYLYHLTIQTSRGEQVFSKTMQVVR